MISKSQIQEFQKIKSILPVSKDLLSVAKNINYFISLFNPMIGIICSVVINNIENGINERSYNKFQERFILLTNTINNILEHNNYIEKNFEASLLCPNLIRQSLIIDDIEKAKDNLKIVECLYASDKYIIDDAVETVDIMSQLSSNEYKLLKVIPVEELKWQNFMNIDTIRIIYAKDLTRLSAYLESLNNKSLIRIYSENTFTGIKDYRLIDYKDSGQTICLSEYGNFFLTNLDLIKSN